MIRFFLRDVLAELGILHWQGEPDSARTIIQEVTLEWDNSKLGAKVNACRFVVGISEVPEEVEAAVPQTKRYLHLCWQFPLADSRTMRLRSLCGWNSQAPAKTVLQSECRCLVVMPKFAV